MTEFPALAVEPGFDPLVSISEAQKFQDQQTLRPYAVQSKLDSYNEDHSAFGNTMMSQAATSALTADPDDAPRIWDDQMNKLAQSGVSGASQYVGHYRPDLAQRVQSAFSSGGGKGGGTKGNPADQLAPAQAQALSQMQPDQKAQALKNMNLAIDGFNKVNDQQSWNAEIEQLKQAGIPVDKMLPSLEYTPMNYRNAYQAIQKLVPMRDAIQGEQTASAFGVNAPITAPVNPGEAKPGDVVYDKTTGKQLFSVPNKENKDNWEVVPATTTGGRPILFNKTTGQYRDPQGGDGQGGGGPASPSYQQFAEIMNHSENDTGNPGATNPNSSATGNGQFIKATWLQTARQAFPGLKGMDDDQLLEMRKLPGFSQDMTAALAQQNAQTLQHSGHPVSTATLAMAHQLGTSDTEKVLDAKPDVALEAILSPEVMKANPQFKGMTAGQYGAQMAKKFGVASVGGGQGGNSPFGNPGGPNEVPPDPESGSIMRNAGISYPAYQLLTNGPTGTGRWPQAVREKATRELEEWADKHNVDTSTFPAEYKANNEVLKANIARNAQAKIMENEVLGTIDNLRPVADDATVGNINRANVAAIFAGKETNGPVSQQYRFYLQQLRRELTGYFATLEPKGGNAQEITDSARHEASDLIADGVSSRGLAGLEDAVVKSQQKMRGILQNSIDDARESVWNQFGVGKNYKRKSQPLENAATRAEAANAAPAPAGGAPRQISPKEQEAMEWLKANPNDPRAGAIKKRLGM